MSATKKPAASAVATTDLANIDFAADVGAGMEGAGSEAFAIPFLKVLQTNSPECDEASSKHMEGAKPGMLLNTVTGDLFDGKEGVVFVPCAYQRRFLRWAPRGSSTQGFRGEMLPEEVNQLRMDNKLVEHEGRVYFPLDDGRVDDKRCDRVTDTRSHFGLVLKEGVPSQVLLPLTSTQIKKSKLLMSLLNQQTVEVGGKRHTAPTFLNTVRITTLKEANDRGSWFGVHFALEGRVPNAAIYEAGKAFHASINAGAVKVNYAETDEVAAGGPAHDTEKF
jgi:hypothetical protein